MLALERLLLAPKRCALWTRRVAGAVALLLAPLVAWADPLTGTVRDGNSLAPIGGATVTAGQASTTATPLGTFSLDVPPGTTEIKITAAGYEDGGETLIVPEGGINGAELLLFRPGATSEIIQIEEQAPAPPPPNRQNLRREEITRIPGARGDALQSLRSLPGVAATTNGGPGVLVIRGSAPEDSRITVDGVEVAVLYHFFGLQSVIPSEFISSIEFVPGGFGAEEGRSTGGVINVVTRDDVVPRAEGFAELSFINLAALVQIPVTRKLQISAAVRRSIIDYVLPVVLPEDSGVNFTAAPTYYDAQLRVDWRATPKDRVSLFLFGSFDNLSLVNNTIDPNDPVTNGATFENETWFYRGIASWTRKTDKLYHRLSLSAGDGQLRFAIADRFLQIGQAAIDAREDLNFKLSERLNLRLGGDARLRYIDLDVRFPAQAAEGEPPPTSFSQLPLVDFMDTVTSHAVSAYSAVDVKPVSKLTLTAGARFDYYDHIDEWTLTPRAQVSLRTSPALTLRAAVGKYSRPLQQAEVIPTNLTPELATQYVVGAEHQHDSGVSTTASVFYTDRDDLVVRDPLLAQTKPLEAYINAGVGRSYGAELLVRIRRQNLFGWAAYTFARSDRIDRPGEARRLFDADQPHNFIVVGSYKLGKWEFGGRFQYATGTPETPIQGSLYLADTNTYIPQYGRVNSARIEDAHSLDLRIDRKWQWGRFKLSAYLDVTNVYAHARVLGYSYNYDFSERQAITELPIVPTIGLRGSL